MKRTAFVIADRKTRTGITEEGDHVEFDRSRWAWIDVDSGERVIARQLVWIDLDEA